LLTEQQKMADDGLKIERVPLSELKEAAVNPRMHGERNLDAIRRSLERFKQAEPLIVRRANNEVIGGNGRLRVMLDLGWDMADCVYLDVDEPTARALSLALNRTAELAEWDDSELADLLAELQSQDYDLADIGFNVDEAAEWLDWEGDGQEEPPEPQLDRAAELQKEWKTALGQLWLIPGKAGEHRLLCGDATKANDVQQCLGGKEPFLCVTDPPYGVEYDLAWRNKAAAEGKLAYAAIRVGPVPHDDQADWSDAWRLFPGHVIYSWHPPGATSLVHAKALQDSGFEIRMQIIWAKSNFSIGRGDYHVQHEPCWYVVRKGSIARRTADRTQTTLWEINLDANVEGGHSTQKPLECMARPIRNHETEEVYDPFIGSGTTMVAAEQLGRICYGMEIEPKYVAVALQRMKDMGLEPRLTES
jgi:DNA modification methylase